MTSKATTTTPSTLEVEEGIMSPEQVLGDENALERIEKLMRMMLDPLELVRILDQVFAVDVSRLRGLSIEEVVSMTETAERLVWTMYQVVSSEEDVTMDYVASIKHKLVKKTTLEVFKKEKATTIEMLITEYFELIPFRNQNTFHLCNPSVSDLEFQGHLVELLKSFQLMIQFNLFDMNRSIDSYLSSSSSSSSSRMELGSEAEEGEDPFSQSFQDLNDSVREMWGKQVARRQDASVRPKKSAFCEVASHEICPLIVDSPLWNQISSYYERTERTKNNEIVDILFLKPQAPSKRKTLNKGRLVWPKVIPQSLITVLSTGRVTEVPGPLGFGGYFSDFASASTFSVTFHPETQEGLVVLGGIQYVDKRLEVLGPRLGQHGVPEAAMHAVGVGIQSSDYRDHMVIVDRANGGAFQVPLKTIRTGIRSAFEDTVYCSNIPKLKSITSPVVSFVLIVKKRPLCHD